MAGEAFAGEKFARRRERREETRRQMKELRDAIRRGLGALVDGAEAIRRIDQEPEQREVLRPSLMEAAGTASRCAHELELSFPEGASNPLPQLLRQGRDLILQGGSQAGSRAAEFELKSTAERLDRIIEAYKNEGRPSVAPIPVPPLLQINWHKLRFWE